MSANLTPAQVMTRLGVQDRRLRRFTVAYEAVFDPLPRDKRGHREFTPEAVERIAAALPVLIERPALGMEDVLRRQAGVVTSTPAAVPAPATATPAPEVLELLSALRADVAALRLEVAALRGELTARDVGAAPAAVEVQDEPQDVGRAPGVEIVSEAPARPSQGLDEGERLVLSVSNPEGLSPAQAEVVRRIQGGGYVVRDGVAGQWFTVGPDDRREKVRSPMTVKSLIKAQVLRLSKSKANLT